jgi:hypothetical protein
VDHTRALAQHDWIAGPAFAGCFIGCHR